MTGHLLDDPGDLTERAQRFLTELTADACPFAPRCPHAVDLCRTVRPVLEATPDGSLVACHRWAELADPAAPRAPQPAAADAPVGHTV